MNLYIRIKDNQPFEHPIIEENFVQAFPHVDLNNLPEWVVKFERIPKPNIGLYEVYEGVTYEWFENKFMDVHHVREMTEEEKLSVDEQILIVSKVFMEVTRV